MIEVSSQPGTEQRSPLMRLQNGILYWFPSLKYVLPLFAVMHIPLFFFSLYAPTLIRPGGAPSFTRGGNVLSVIWRSWYRFDTEHYLSVLQHGYGHASGRTAFFPLYPFLARAVSFLVHDPLISALLVTHCATFVVLLVSYQLGREEWGEQTGKRIVWYLLAFPSSLFLWAAYAEAIFLCLMVLIFYSMRHQKWWFVGVFGFLASLARPSGILLVLPICFEYLRQRQFRLRSIRWDILSILFVPAGLALYAFFCYQRFGDWQAFSHAQANWLRSYHLSPFDGIVLAIQHSLATQRSLLVSLYMTQDLWPDLLVLTGLVVAVTGFCRLGSRHWTYILTVGVLWVFANSFPSSRDPVLMAVGRNMLTLFPIFLIFAQLGRFAWFHWLYLGFAGSLCIFWLTLFVSGYGVV